MCSWPIDPALIQLIVIGSIASDFPVKLLVMLPRELSPPDDSFFLFGARSTGKTTWISQHFADAAAHYDLLRNDVSPRLSRDPGVLSNECSALPTGAWIVLDEVQRVPPLLDEVQHLMTTRQQRFVLSGSSARKLKRGGANLLAGRAELCHLYPLVSAEIGVERELDEILAYGLMPLAVTGKRPKAFLRSYCQVYLREEIQSEALVRNIGAFQRFLEVAARVNAQTVNVTGVARDAGVARQTVQDYFDILIDTLLGFRLPAWKLKRGVKQVALSKFYFFDCGVVRELAGTSHLQLHPEERGFLFETFILHEIRAYLHYRGLEYPLSYWRTHNDREVDFVIDTPAGLLAIECKSSARWDSRFNAGLLKLQEFIPDRRVRKLGVYSGPNALTNSGVYVLPWREFLAKLWSGELFESNEGV